VGGGEPAALPREDHRLHPQRVDQRNPIRHGLRSLDGLRHGRFRLLQLAQRDLHPGEVRQQWGEHPAQPGERVEVREQPGPRPLGLAPQQILLGQGPVQLIENRE
jgi:hypothetical protein